MPHPGNDHRPHALKHRVLFGYSVLLVLIKVLAIVAPVVLPSSSLYSSAITSQNIIDLTNQTRQNLNLGELNENAQLAQAATAKAQDMLTNQYFAHVSPEGRTPWSWMVDVGYKYRYAGENLAVHFTTAESVNDGWLASPSHRANIVNANYTEIGIGVAMGEYEGFPTTFVVQMFGQPTTVPSQVATAITVPASPPQPAPAPVESQPSQVASAQSSTPKPVTPAPVPVPTPVEPVSAPVEPTPTPVEPLPTTPEAIASLPQLDESSVTILPTQNGYEVRLSMTGASAVTLHLAAAWTPMTRPAGGEGTWQGSVAYDPAVLATNGEPLSVVATTLDGQAVSYALAWVAPEVRTQQLYTFNEGSDRYVKLFGSLAVHNLQDSVRQFYFFFMIFLGAALLINILVKIRIQKLSVLGHATLVLLLTAVLSVI